MGATIRGSGARYNPTFNTWGPITTSSAPSARYDHSAVWTDKEMLVWGGCSGTSYYDTLKRLHAAGHPLPLHQTLNSPEASISQSNESMKRIRTPKSEIRGKSEPGNPKP